MNKHLLPIIRWESLIVIMKLVCSTICHTKFFSHWEIRGLIQRILVCFSWSWVSVSVPYLAVCSSDVAQEGKQHNSVVLESDIYLIIISVFVYIRKYSTHSISSVVICHMMHFWILDKSWHFLLFSVIDWFWFISGGKKENFLYWISAIQCK